MKRVMDFFKSIENKPLNDEPHIQDENSPKNKPWKDNVIQVLSIFGVAMAFNGLSLPAYASALLPSKNQSYQQQGNEIIRDMYIQGLLTSKYKMNVVKLSAGSDSSANIIPGMPCKVLWALNKKGEAQDLIQGIDIEQSNLYREMALLHELSHCELIKIENPFRNSGLKSTSEKLINSWVIGPQIPHTPINNFFSENFADTYGMLMLLRKYDFSQEALNELTRWYEVRKVKREMDERSGNPLTADPHYTDFSLKEIIDRLPEIKSLSPVMYKSLALEIASHSTLEWLNKNRKVQLEGNIDSSGNSVKPLGDVGVQFLLGNLQSGQTFYDSLIGQAQLKQAEKQNLIDTLPPTEASTMLGQILSSYHIDDTRVKVKMNAQKNLRWDNSQANGSADYINAVLDHADAGKFIEKWKINNDWNNVARDINMNLSKEININHTKDKSLLSSAASLKDKILNKMSGMDASSEVPKINVIK